MLLEGLSVARRPGEFVLVSLESPPEVPYQASVIEAEGTTYVVERRVADDNGWGYDFVAAWLTVEAHSSLHAVGLTAALARCLAQQDIPANVMAGTYHDHLLVPVEKVPEDPNDLFPPELLGT